MTEHPRYRAPGAPPGAPFPHTASSPQPGGEGAPVAERVARALCVTGLVVSIATITELLAPLLVGTGALGTYLRFRRTYEALFLLHLALAVICAALLFAGCVGELRRRQWGRPLLVLYLWLWVASALTWTAGVYTFRVDDMPSMAWVYRREMILTVTAQQVGYLVSRGVYPLLLALWLRWPESRRAAFDPRGFRPVLPVGGE